MFSEPKNLLRGDPDLHSVGVVGVFGEVGAAGVAGRNVLDTIRATHGVEGIVRTGAVQEAGRSVEDKLNTAGTQHQACVLKQAAENNNVSN